ncbi:hypothetical protein SAMN05421823_109212 [Catalinimonas alkaloidigena]|uniref:Uncharacterized protein n=1 Tax=Catalinimonas alkaloidigena TaxID=1075417 RepID=A0A1G9PKR5_9BACT|nr:hypothetical protein [Catalinimonas alkaloidigena]SDL98787.1 hypothetical protein SAMN05421823_109212 [Catalinimonas alkaloidigena]
MAIGFQLPFYAQPASPLLQWTVARLGHVALAGLLPARAGAPGAGAPGEDFAQHYYRLVEMIPNYAPIDAQTLLYYDTNLQRHRAQLDSHCAWHHTYEMYLLLVFTELYLDAYFSNPQALRDALNRYNWYRHKASLYPLDELRCLSFSGVDETSLSWLMHMNLMQYRHYLHRHNREDEVQRTILLVRDETHQQMHLRQMQGRRIKAKPFAETQPDFFEHRTVEVMRFDRLNEIKCPNAFRKLAAESLLLIDSKGHTTGKSRPGHRGFVFEYSQEPMLVDATPEAEALACARGEGFRLADHALP